MKQALGSIVLIGLAVGPARGEPDTVEAAAGDVSLLPVGPAHWHGRLFAQLGTTDDEAGGAVGADGAYRGPRCDYLRAGGQLRVGMNDAAHAAAEQWASVCIPVIAWEFGHRLEWDVRPSLLAPLGLRPGGNRRETLHFRWHPLRGRLIRIFEAAVRGEAAKEGVPPPPPLTPAERARWPQGDLALLDVDLSDTILWTDGQPTASLQQVETALIRYVHDDFTVDTFSGGGAFADQGALVHVWLVKLEHLGLGPLAVTGGIGIASAGAGPFVDAVSREVDVTEPRWVAGLAYRRGRVSAEVRTAHEVALVPDGYVTVETRTDAMVTFEDEASRLALTGTRANTEVDVPGLGEPIRAITGGVALDLSRRLTTHLTAAARLEVARSFYAADVLAFDRMPRWGATGFAVIEAALAH